MSDAYGAQITLPGLYVNSDISAKQYHAVKMGSTANTVIALSASTDVIAGVLQNAPDAANEAAIVAALGVTTVVAGTSVLTAGARIQFNSTGQAIAASGKDEGYVLEAASASGDELRAVLD